MELTKESAWLPCFLSGHGFMSVCHLFVFIKTYFSELAIKIVSKKYNISLGTDLNARIVFANVNIQHFFRQNSFTFFRYRGSRPFRDLSITASYCLARLIISD